MTPSAGIDVVPPQRHLPRTPTSSTRLKIGLAFSLLAAVLFAGVGAWSGWHARQQVERSTGEALLQLAGNVVLSLDSGLFERYREIVNMAALEDVLEKPLDRPAWTELLERLKTSLPQYSWIGVADLQGKVAAATGEMLVGKDVSARPWFVKGQIAPYAGDVHEAVLLSELLGPASPGGEPLRFLDFAAPLMREGRKIGVLGSHLSWSWAQGRCQAALGKLDAARHVEVAVFDAQGRELLRPGSDALLKLAPAQLEQVVARHYDVVTWEDGEAYLTAAVRSTGYGSYPGLGWTIVVRQPLSTAVAAAEELQHRIWALGVVATALFGMMGWWLAGRLTAPLRAVAAHAREVADSMKLSFADGGAERDEVRQLAASLASLVNQLRAREQDLRGMNETLEARVAERTESLRQANADLESFSRSISHDLKTPISTIAAMLRNMVKTRPERFEARDREILLALAEECDRLHELVDGMMVLAWVDHRSPTIADVDMRQLVDAVVAELRTVRAMQGGGGAPEVETVVAPLPRLDGDPVLLRQVWHNLLGNAFKFTSKTAAPCIEVGCEQEGDNWVFWVKDNGPGFDPTQANALFSAYQRLHDAKDFPGTGVGLSIVKRVVQRHGGKVWCTSEAGRGAQFFFSLPRARSVNGAP